ncbi:uncharacterized protein LOC127437548 [Myxocyprinus asiaticus]|uniref:uncharacterized protein LOC127437548 n=1 Tax=Myxocyprinus asiaticus TaxID=70543 RepID=UPI002222D127|nr:uncharacterized protein LOC127437548 [Myxocyprinus asiaticus]
MKSNFTNVRGQVNDTWHNTIEVAFLAANCLVLLVTLHIGILANLFVTWAVHHQKSLQTSNNALLVNLAIIDILRCAIDCPFLLSIVLSARDSRDLGLLFCSAQIASFSLICCVQLLTLACISAERYQAIAHPFKTAERRKRITMWIPLTWVVPISISVLCVIFAKDSPVYIRCRGLRMDTLDSYDTFGFYILTPVWCVCLVVIIGFYARIFLLVRAHSRKIFDKGSFPPPDKKKEDTSTHKEETKSSDPEKAQIVDTDDYSKPNEMNEHVRKTNTNSLHVNIPGIVSEISKETKVTFKNEFINEASQVIDLEGAAEPNTHQDTSPETLLPTNGEGGAVEASAFQGTAPETSPSSTNGEGGSKPNDHQESAVETSPTSTNGEDGSEPNSHQDSAAETSPTSTNGDGGVVESNTTKDTAETSPASNEEAKTATAPQEEVVGAVCIMPSLAQRERGNAKKESKLAKRSGYIILTFLVFWIPLILTVVLNHLFYHNSTLTVSFRVSLTKKKKKKNVFKFTFSFTLQINFLVTSPALGYITIH